MPAAAFFDVDKTLWACSGEKAFADYQYRRGQLGGSQLLGVVYPYLRYELGIISDVDTLKRRVTRTLFAGETVTPCIEAYREHYYAHLSQFLFPAMLDCVRNHQLAGDKVVLVSAAVDFIVNPIAQLLCADECYASQLEIADNRFTGEILGPIHYGQVKALVVKEYAARHGLDLTQCHAYGDHWEDRYMLCAVGNPVAINPGYRLAKLARRQQWPTLVLPSPL